MKTLFLLLIISLVLPGCSQDTSTRKEIDDLKDIVLRQSDSIADAYADIKDLQDAKASHDTLIMDIQQEQTFMIKDMDYAFPIVNRADSFLLKESGRFRWWRRAGRAGGYAREGFRLVTGR